MHAAWHSNFSPVDQVANVEFHLPFLLNLVRTPFLFDQEECSKRARGKQRKAAPILAVCDVLGHFSLSRGASVASVGYGKRFRYAAELVSHDARLCTPACHNQMHAEKPELASKLIYTLFRQPGVPQWRHMGGHHGQTAGPRVLCRVCRVDQHRLLDWRVCG